MAKKTSALRGIALFLVMACILSLMSPGGGTRAATDEASEAANALYSLGLFQGVGTDAQGRPIFDLDRAPTRNEAVTMLVRLLGKETEAKARPYSAPFTDVQEWAKPYVNYAYSAGLTSGTSATTYSGNDIITASQYISFVLRALGYSSGLDFAWDRAWELSDILEITHGQYRSGSAFTRGDVAVISYRALSVCIKGTTKTLHESNTPAQSNTIPFGSSFEIHFIDVGEADAALALCDGHAMMIDGGNVADSSLIYSYLKAHDVTHLDYMVCTHPHEDHVGGLAGALNYASVGVAYCSATSYDTKAFDSFVKYLGQQGLSITVPTAGTTFMLGSASVQVVGPCSWDENMNNNSIVLRIVYGNTSFLFTGDAEREEELEIIDAGYNIESTLLKVGHHGSSDASSYPFIYMVNPQYAVISVGKDNGNGHPAEATLSRLKDADVTVYRTDLNGHIICYSDGNALTFTTNKQEQPTETRTMPTQPTEPITNGGGQTAGAGSYVLNTNTHKFHYPSCSAVTKMSEKNKQIYNGSRDEIIAMGYSPCGICKP